MENTSKEKIKQILYRIEDIEILDYKSTDPQSFADRIDAFKNIQVTISTHGDVNEKNGTISALMDVAFSKEYSCVKHEIINIKTSHIFRIKEFNKVIEKDEEGRPVLPNWLILNFLSIAISGTRGMIAARNVYPEYKKVILPLMDPTQMLKGLKKNSEKAD